MFEVFEDYIAILFADVTTVAFGASILFLILAVAALLMVLTPKKKKNVAVVSPRPLIRRALTSTESPAGTADVSPAAPEPVIVLGTGEYKCIAIRSPKLLGYDADVNIIDFTSMPEPMGELHFADTSCPISGGVYIVKESEDGTLKDYDPRQVVMDVKTTPERAYQATHWPELKIVWGTVGQVWKSVSFWFAIACLILTFFISAQAMGA